MVGAGGVHDFDTPVGARTKRPARAVDFSDPLHQSTDVDGFHGVGTRLSGKGICGLALTVCRHVSTCSTLVTWKTGIFLRRCSRHCLAQSGERPSSRFQCGCGQLSSGSWRQTRFFCVVQVTCSVYGDWRLLDGVGIPARYRMCETIARKQAEHVGRVPFRSLHGLLGWQVFTSM